MKFFSVFLSAAFLAIFMNVSWASAAPVKSSSVASECKAYEPLVTNSCVLFAPPDIQKIIADAECKFDGNFTSCFGEGIHYRMSETLYFPATGQTVRRNKTGTRDAYGTDFTRAAAMNKLRSNIEYFAKWLARNKCSAK